MFDIGWSEMLMIIIVMIIVIGPKDLPKVMRTAGQWMGRVRGMAREFQSSIEQMAEQSGVEDLRKEIQSVSKLDVQGEIERAIDPKGDLRGGLGIEPPGGPNRGPRAAEPASAPRQEALPAQPVPGADDKAKP